MVRMTAGPKQTGILVAGSILISFENLLELSVRPHRSRPARTSARQPQDHGSVGLITRLLVAVCVAVASIALAAAQLRPSAGSVAAAPTPPPADLVAPQRAVVDKYCVTCHNERAKTAGLLLDQLDMSHLGDHAEVGERV